MKAHWVLLIFLLSLALGSCGPSQTVVEDSTTLTPEHTNVVSTVTADVTGAWKTYRNTEAGYSAKYPADWVVDESVGINGELMTTFMAPTEGQGIAVSVLNSEAAIEEVPDMPNTRCQQVTISGLPGRHCFDTLAFNFSTTFLDHGKQYIIASSGKHLDQNIYQRFLENFTLTP